MTMTASKEESFVMGNKRCERWTFTGSTDTGGTFTAGITPEACVYGGSTGTAPVALVLTFNKSTKVVTVTYTSGSPVGGKVLVIGH